MAGETLFLGGIFDIQDPFFGLPIYAWLWIFVLFLTLCTWLTFRYAVWTKYTVLWGLYDAFKAHSKAVFTFDIRLGAELLSEARAKIIADYSKYEYVLADVGAGFFAKFHNFLRRFLFYYPTAYLDSSELSSEEAILNKFGHVNMDVQIAKKLEGETDWIDIPSVSIGGIDTDLVLDADRWSIPKSLQHKEIEKFRDAWNDTYPDDRIESYMKLQRYMLNGKITQEDMARETPHVKSMIIIPWIRIDSAFPTVIEDNEQAGARRQQAKDDEQNIANAINKYIPYVLGAGIGFAFLILVFRFATVAMAGPKPV